MQNVPKMPYKRIEKNINKQELIFLKEFHYLLIEISV